MVHLRLPDGDIELDWDTFEQRVAEGRVPSDALIRLDAVTHGAFVRADSLELYRELAAGRQGAFVRLQAQAGPPILTALLVGVQVRIWWLCRVGEVRSLAERHLTKWSVPILEDGEVWRVITMGFVHTNLGHALANLTWLAYASFHLERALGWRNLLFLYVGSVAGGSLLSMVGSPDTPSLGASGGIFGLIAATVVFGLSRPELLPERARRVFGFALLPYLALMLFSGARSAGVDNWAHLGGLLVGGGLALVVDPPGLERHPGRSARVRALGAGLLVVVLAALAVAGPRLEGLRTQEQARWLALRSRSAEAARRTPPADPGPVGVLLPVGWSQGSTLAGKPAWSPPTAPRSWAVWETRQPRPVAARTQVDALREQVDALGWPTTWSAPEPTTLAGLPALRLSGTVAASTDLDVELVVAVRGVHVLTASWEVEPERRARLSPLHERLLQAVTWEEPAAVREARARAQRSPDGIAARLGLAGALAEVGEGEEALRLHAALVAEAPTDTQVRLDQLHTVSWYPERVPGLDALLDDALGADLGPAVTAAVADVLDAAGRPDDALGLLDLAWYRAPGERTLARARRGRSLSTELGPDGDVPATPWRPAQAPHPPTIAAAQAQGRSRAQARAALVATIAQAAPGSATLADALVLLAREGPATEAALALVRADLERAREGHPPSWWTVGLPEAADLLAALASPQD